MSAVTVIDKMTSLSPPCVGRWMRTIVVATTTAGLGRSSAVQRAKTTCDVDVTRAQAKNWFTAKWWNIRCAKRSFISIGNRFIFFLPHNTDFLHLIGGDDPQWLPNSKPLVLALWHKNWKHPHRQKNSVLNSILLFNFKQLLCCLSPLYTQNMFCSHISFNIS